MLRGENNARKMSATVKGVTEIKVQMWRWQGSRVVLRLWTTHDCLPPAKLCRVSGILNMSVLFVSSQLISSDADGAIQRAGRFRVENGSSDEVQAANKGGIAQPRLPEMIFICNQSKCIVFISIEHTFLLHTKRRNHVIFSNIYKKKPMPAGSHKQHFPLWIPLKESKYICEMWENTTIIKK